jgi:choline-glycine betaine transporter
MVLISLICACAGAWYGIYGWLNMNSELEFIGAAALLIFSLSTIFNIGVALSSRPITPNEVFE